MKELLLCIWAAKFAATAIIATLLTMFTGWGWPLIIGGVCFVMSAGCEEHILRA